jgi:hypothetical protein
MFNMSLKFDSHFTSFENTLDTIVMDSIFGSRMYVLQISVE